jgi:hypothetical protein
VYLTSAFLAFLYFLSERIMNNLRVCNGLDGSIPTRASTNHQCLCGYFDVFFSRHLYVTTIYALHLHIPLPFSYPLVVMPLRDLDRSVTWHLTDHFYRDTL